MNRYKTILKEAEKKRSIGNIEPLVLEVKNKKFVQLIEELKNYSINTQDNISNEMLDSMRLTVLAKHFEELEKEDVKPTYQWIYNKMLSIASFRDYCGANTPILKLIEEDRDLTQPYKIDEICRAHDYSYTQSKNINDIYEADKKMLQSIFEQYVIGEYDPKTSSTVLNFLTNHLFQKTIPNIFKLVLSFQFIYKTPQIIKHITSNFKSYYNLMQLNKEDIQNRLNDVVELNRDIENQYILNEEVINQINDIVKEEYKPYYKQFGQEAKAGLVDLIWNTAGTGLIVDTFFSVVSAFAIGFKMIFESSTGYQITGALDEYSFDPFDIEQQVKEFLEYQKIRQKELNIVVEPFKSSIDIFSLSKSQKEVGLKTIEPNIKLLEPIKTLDTLINEFLTEEEEIEEEIKVALASNSKEFLEAIKPEQVSALDTLINKFLSDDEL